uniref:Uncharacterized protein n=1 Tax=Clytia hemisphaerica TaxID=252671 RepID=A0A7M5WWQ9_9CNID
MEALDFSCENKFISFSVILIFIYYLINFIVDHWISTEEKKNVLVTGCDSGFGFQTALELSESNCKVFAGCLTQDGVKRLESNARFRGMAFIMDVTKDEDVQKAKEVIEENGVVSSFFNSIKITQNIGEVTKRIRHALLAKFPRRRYITGLDSKLYAIGSHLPTAFVDWIISCKIGILHPKTTTKKSQ